MSSSLSQFNTAIYDFVRFIRDTGHMSADVDSLETYIEVTRVNARILISNFQKYVLRDVFVSNILQNNVNYFLNFDIVKEYNIDDANIALLINRIRELVGKLVEEKNTENIDKTFNWIKVLCFHAYTDIGIPAAKKFRALLSIPNTTSA
tara:strand:+ start:387 stop:833 length:447 start_codon:yes stop_codon:yes gene_type:complete